MTPQREAELLVQIDLLTDRVIAAMHAQADAEDLRRENNELRAAMAELPTGAAAVAKLREWTAEGRHAYEPGAIQIAMPVSTACKIIDEIDRLHAQAAKADGVVQELCHESAERLRLMREALAERDKARVLARKLLGDIELWVGFEAIGSLHLDALPDWLTASL